VKDYFKVLEERALDRCVPLRAIVELTYRCNLRCVHCYTVGRAGERELGTEEVRGILDQLAGEGCLYLTFTGGEILLREDFFALAAYARRKRFALRLFTNGSFLTTALFLLGFAVTGLWFLKREWPQYFPEYIIYASLAAAGACAIAWLVFSRRRLKASAAAPANPTRT